MTRSGDERAQVEAPGALPRYHVVAEIVESAPLPGEHHRLTVCAPEIAACAQPGQFLHIWCHPPEEIAQPPSTAVLRRPLSISRLRPPDHLELLLRVRGVGGTILSHKVSGDELDAIGPLGHGFEVPRGLEVAVIVAGGIGIAPVPFLAESLGARQVRVIILVGAKEDSRLPFAVVRPADGPASVPDLEAMGAEVHYVSEAVEGQLVSELLKERREEFIATGAGFFAVGPRPMLRRVTQLIEGRAQLQVSLEERMACGVGACRSCVVPVKGPEGRGLAAVCREGPVFDAARVDWERLSDASP